MTNSKHDLGHNIATVRKTLYESSDALVMENEKLCACSMCINGSGHLLLNYDPQETTHGMLALVRNKDIEIQVIGKSILSEMDNPEVLRFKNYFPHMDAIHQLLIIVPEKYIYKNSEGSEYNLNTEVIDLNNEFSGEIENRMTEHMNEDHVDAMCAYCDHIGVKIGNDDPHMLGIDQYGFDLLVNNERVRFHFKEKCPTPQAVREALVELANIARAVN